MWTPPTRNGPPRQPTPLNPAGNAINAFTGSHRFVLGERIGRCDIGMLHILVEHRSIQRGVVVQSGRSQRHLTLDMTMKLLRREDDLRGSVGNVRFLQDLHQAYFISLLPASGLWEIRSKDGRDMASILCDPNYVEHLPSSVYDKTRNRAMFTRVRVIPYRVYRGSPLTPVEYRKVELRDGFGAFDWSSAWTRLGYKMQPGKTFQDLSIFYRDFPQIPRNDCRAAQAFLQGLLLDGTIEVFRVRAPNSPVGFKTVLDWWHLQEPIPSNTFGEVRYLARADGKLRAGSKNPGSVSPERPSLKKQVR